MRAGQIILETARAYTIDTRAYAPDIGSCTYYDSTTGRMCAVGRCMIDPKPYESIEGAPDEVVHAAGATVLDELLLPKYRGHNEEFWDALQLLHDQDRYWDTTGLSEGGWYEMLVLMDRYDPTFTMR